MLLLRGNFESAVCRDSHDPWGYNCDVLISKKLNPPCHTYSLRLIVVCVCPMSVRNYRKCGDCPDISLGSFPLSHSGRSMAVGPKALNQKRADWWRNQCVREKMLLLCQTVCIATFFAWFCWNLSSERGKLWTGRKISQRFIVYWKGCSALHFWRR